ncbi:MAG TPA: hypothetical protein VE338_18530 [Ktedonobacterales bacterium]|nr:hypothetical protein [Ktedonobacterales bacterium]
MASSEERGWYPRRWWNWWATVTSAVSVALLMSGCAPGGGSVLTLSTPTPTPTMCTSHAETTAQARTVSQQLYGQIGSRADGALSDLRYPLGLPNEDFVASLGNPPHPGYSVFSPNGKYLATDVLLEGPNIVSAYPYVINTATHLATRLPVPASVNVDGAYYNEWLRERSLAWVDDHTLLFFAGANTNTTVTQGSRGTRVFIYNMATGSASLLSGVTAAAGGIVRCGILYYQEVTPLAPYGPVGWLKGKALLHRYDLRTRTEIGAPIGLGETFGFGGWESHFDGPGWDVSADGHLLVYQQTRVIAASDRLVMTSQFMRANPDGSGGARILMAASPSVTMLISISPANKLVAATDGDVDALRDPEATGLISDSMTVVGSTTAGSSVEYFSIIGTVLPAWTVGDRFLASRADSSAINGIGATIYSYRFDGASTSAPTSVATDATYPATLIV